MAAEVSLTAKEVSMFFAFERKSYPVDVRQQRDNNFQAETPEAEIHRKIH